MEAAVEVAPKLESEYIWYGLAALVIVLGVLYVIGHNPGNGGNGGPDEEPEPEPQPDPGELVYIQ